MNSQRSQPRGRVRSSLVPIKRPADAARRDEKGGREIGFAGDGVAERTRDRGRHDRRERGGRGTTLVEAEQPDQQRDHDRAAADSEGSGQRSSEGADEKKREYSARRIRLGEGLGQARSVHCWGTWTRTKNN